MSDITKCTNNLCPIKHTCFRWTAPADPLWQAYQCFYYTNYPRIEQEVGLVYVARCDHHIPAHRNHPVTESE